MILMEKEAIFPTDVETSKDFALILYAAKHRMLNAERIRTPTATRLIMNPSRACLSAYMPPANATCG
jgi:hypothetical protein